MSARLKAKKQEFEQLRAIPGIAIEPMVFSVIELLLSHLDNPETTLILSLRSYVVSLEAQDIVGYLFQLNDQESLSEGLNDTVKTVIEILKNQALVGEKISRAFSSLTSLMPQQDERRPQSSDRAYSASSLPPVSVNSESDGVGQRVHNTLTHAAGQTHVPVGLFLSARGQSVAHVGVTSSEEHRSFSVKTDASIGAKDHAQSTTDSSSEIPEDTPASLKKPRFE